MFGALFGWMPWREPLSWNPRLDVAAGSVSPQPLGTKWLLRGITSNERYVVREEKDRLVAKQPSLGRAEATCAALILSGKTPHGGDWLKTNAGRFLRSSPSHSHWAPISPCCGPSSPPLSGPGRERTLRLLDVVRIFPV